MKRIKGFYEGTTAHQREEFLRRLSQAASAPWKKRSDGTLSDMR